jgi:hypothetical protein
MTKAACGLLLPAGNSGECAPAGVADIIQAGRNQHEQLRKNLISLRGIMSQLRIGKVSK